LFKEEEVDKFKGVPGIVGSSISTGARHQLKKKLVVG